MEYASNGKANLGVTLGAIGTGLSAMEGLGMLGMGNRGNCHPYSFVSRDELYLVQQLANKDSEIATLKSESNTEEKMIEVYKQAHSEIANLRDRMDNGFKELQCEINTNRREQDQWNATQSVANANMSAAIATNHNSISAIRHIVDDITQVKVPNSAVCPGWGDIP